MGFQRQVSLFPSALTVSSIIVFFIKAKLNFTYPNVLTAYVKTTLFVQKQTFSEQIRTI
ncbi:hypothetical protein QE439_004260 [Pedobacter agri]|nr:hypothetical protein [Pedobacter agri]